MAHENIFGSAIAGALISTAMFRTFVEKGLLTPEEAASVMNQAANAVRDFAHRRRARRLSHFAGPSAAASCLTRN